MNLVVEIIPHNNGKTYKSMPLKLGDYTTDIHEDYRQKNTCYTLTGTGYSCREVLQRDAKTYLSRLYPTVKKSALAVKITVSATFIKGKKTIFDAVLGNINHNFAGFSHVVGSHPSFEYDSTGKISQFAYFNESDREITRNLFNLLIALFFMRDGSKYNLSKIKLNKNGTWANKLTIIDEMLTTPSGKYMLIPYGIYLLNGYDRIDPKNLESKFNTLNTSDRGVADFIRRFESATMLMNTVSYIKNRGLDLDSISAQLGALKYDNNPISLTSNKIWFFAALDKINDPDSTDKIKAALESVVGDPFPSIVALTRDGGVRLVNRTSKLYITEEEYNK